MFIDQHYVYPLDNSIFIYFCLFIHLFALYLLNFTKGNCSVISIVNLCIYQMKT